MAERVDPKVYYGYLFLPDKKPSKVLDALLRGIAKYIIECIGDTNAGDLTPTKLAAFYRVVGGKYDSLFLETPHTILSNIYQSIGCQHCLLPTSNNFAPPSIPALTIPGFVRWEAIQILLGPEEHVPYIQTALRDFGIKHPDTGEPFPVDLPTEAFPLHSDIQIEKWHRQCGQKLLQDASPEVHEASILTDRSGYSHVTAQNIQGSKERRFAGNNALKPSEASSASSNQRRTRPPLSHQPSRRSRRASDVEDFLETPLGRRMSVPDNLYVQSPSISPLHPISQPGLQSPMTHRTRRHSHPRTQGRRDSSSSSSDSDTQPTSDASLSPGPSPRRDFRAAFPNSMKSSSSAPSSTSPLNAPLAARQRGRSVPQIVPDPPLPSRQVPINISSPSATPIITGSRLSSHFQWGNSVRWYDGLEKNKVKFDSRSSSDWEQEKARRASQDNYIHSGLRQPRSGSHDSRTRGRMRSSGGHDDGREFDFETRPRRYYGELGFGLVDREEMSRR